MNKLQKQRLASNVRKLRESRDMSGREAAAEAGISQPMWSQIETGARVPSLETALAMADMFGVPLSRIFRGL